MLNRRASGGKQPTATTRVPRKPRVAWLGVEPAPYNMPLLEYLHQSGELEMHLFFCAAHIDQAWALEQYDYLVEPESRRRAWALCKCYWNPAILRTLLRQRWDVVVVSGYSNPTMQAAMLSSLVRRIPFIIQGDTQLLRPRSWWRRAIKRLLVRPVVSRCGAAVGVGELARQYWESLGVPKGRAFVVPCSSHLAEFVSRAQALAPARNENPPGTGNSPRGDGGDLRGEADPLEARSTCCWRRRPGSRPPGSRTC